MSETVAATFLTHISKGIVWKPSQSNVETSETESAALFCQGSYMYCMMAPGDPGTFLQACGFCCCNQSVRVYRSGAFWSETKGKPFSHSTLLANYETINKCYTGWILLVETSNFLSLKSKAKHPLGVILSEDIYTSWCHFPELKLWFTTFWLLSLLGCQARLINI